MGKNNKKKDKNKAAEIADRPVEDKSLDAINEYLEETLGNEQVAEQEPVKEETKTVTKEPKNTKAPVEPGEFIASFDTKFMTWKTYSKSGHDRTGDIVVPKEYKDLFRKKQEVRVQLTPDLSFNSKIAILNQSWSIHVPIDLTKKVMEYFKDNPHVEIYSV